MRLLHVGLRHDQQELLAAPAQQAVGASQRRHQTPGRLAQDLIAGLMAMVVVDRLEVVEVDESQRQRTILALCAVPLQSKDLLSAAAGENPGERVADGLAHQREHERQLAHAGQAGDAGDQDQQPEGTGERRPVQRRPAEIASQRLGQQQQAGEHQILHQGQRENGQPGHQHEW